MAKARWSRMAPLEPVEFGAGLFLDEAAPELGQALGAGRRLEAGQALARQHRHRVLERRLVALARLGEGAAVIAVVEHGGEVGGDAFHPARADRLDPRLLDGVEQRRAPPGYAARGGDGRRRCGRRAAARANRRGRAGSPPRADWACAAAPAGAPWPRRARSPAPACRWRRRLSSSGWRASARVQEASARLNGSFGAFGFAAGLAVAGRFDVDGRHGGLLFGRPRRGPAGLSIGLACGGRQGDCRSTNGRAALRSTTDLPQQLGGAAPIFQRAR